MTNHRPMLNAVSRRLVAVPLAAALLAGTVAGAAADGRWAAPPSGSYSSTSSRWSAPVAAPGRTTTSTGSRSYSYVARPTTSSGSAVRATSSYARSGVRARLP